jgi:predicted protein tyrosine phosphatase
MRSGVPRPIRVLFICQFNRKRSATAERVFGKDPSLDVRSAGTSADALVKVNERMLDWADIVFIMDEQQRRALEHEFPGNERVARIVSLEIDDNYNFLDPELIELLRSRAIPHIERVKRAK